MRQQLSERTEVQRYSNIIVASETIAFSSKFQPSKVVRRSSDTRETKR